MSWGMRIWHCVRRRQGHGIQGGGQALAPAFRLREMCPSCKRRDQYLHLRLPKTAGIGPDGGYAEYFLVRTLGIQCLLDSRGVDPKDAVLFDVICVALHGIRKSKFKLGDNVVSGTAPLDCPQFSFKGCGANKIIALGTTSSNFPCSRRRRGLLHKSQRVRGSELKSANPRLCGSGCSL